MFCSYFKEQKGAYTFRTLQLRNPLVGLPPRNLVCAHEKPENQPCSPSQLLWLTWQKSLIFSGEQGSTVTSEAGEVASSAANGSYSLDLQFQDSNLWYPLAPVLSHTQT